MTISTLSNSVTHIGDGVTTEFPFTFPVREEATFFVSLFQISTATTTEISSGNYAVTGIGPDSVGGTVTYELAGNPISSDYELTLTRTVPLTQEFTVGRLSDFNPETLEQALDNVVMGLQQVSNQTQVIQEFADDLNGAIDGAVAAQNAAEAAALAAEASELSAAASALAAAASALSVDADNLLTKAGNLSGLADPATARSNLGLVIGASAGNVVTWDTGGKYKAADGSQITAVNAATLGGKSVGGAAGDIPVLNGSGVVSGDDLPSGSIVQRFLQTTGAYSTVSTNIPLDDTIPQITEGAQLFSQSITPKFSDSLIRVRACGYFHTGGGGPSNIMAMFINGAANAVAAGMSYANSQPWPLPLEYTYAPGTVAAQTIALRIGPSGGTMHINGNGGRYFGGTFMTWLAVEEIRP